MRKKMSIEPDGTNKKEFLKPKNIKFKKSYNSEMNVHNVQDKAD